MAELGTQNPNYLDWTKRLDPDGSIATVAEILSETNPIVGDAVVVEANGPTSHRTTVRTGLPTGTWRRLNYGVQVEKSRTAQITDTIGMLEAYAEVDKDLAVLNGNSAAWRMSEEKAFIEGLSQSMADTVVYGNTDTDPEKFLGLTYRYNDRSAESGRMIVDDGGSGADQSSIWGVVWGADSCHMTFPKGSSAGLSFQDLGEETLSDAAGGLYQGFRSHYQWKAGLVVRDWRQVTRIVVDTGTVSSNNLLDHMADAQNQLNRPNSGRLVWYANRTLKSRLDKEAMNKTNMALTTQQQDNGGPVTMFWGKPVRLLDSILNTEAAV